MSDHPDPARRWRNRRRMAWLSLLAGLAYPFAAGMGYASSDVSNPFYFFLTGVVCFYIGGATYAEARQP